MPEVFSLQPPENNNDNYDRRQSPTFSNTDRHTPMPYENSHEKKTEMYHFDTKNEHERPIHNQSPFQPSSSPVNSIHHPSGNGPELYHLKMADNNNDIHDRRSSPAIVNSNRLSPALYQHSTGEGPEMYHLRTTDENGRQSPYIIDNHQKVKFNDDIRHDDDNHDQRKITTYLLTSSEGDNRENFPPHRTPSPPIHSTKKKEPFTYDTVDDDHKYSVSNEQRAFPTALHDVPSNVRYVPLSHSKASESIQRSMNKYRFAGS